MNPRNLVPAVLACFVPAFLAAQPSPTPAPAPVSSPPAVSPTPAPNIDLRMIRMKISAGDLPSAESILEYHRADAIYALGTAIEVDAQRLAAAGKKTEAIGLLGDSSKSLQAKGAPYNIRARVWKRRNMMELEGKPAPAIRAEDRVGAEAPSLESLRGKPVVLFFWWEACGDCKMQADAFRKVVEKYGPRGVTFVAPTRYYHPGDHAEDREVLERAVQADRIRPGAGLRRSDAPLRDLRDADVRVREPQGVRHSLRAHADDGSPPLCRNRRAAHVARAALTLRSGSRGC